MSEDRSNDNGEEIEPSGETVAESSTPVSGESIDALQQELNAKEEENQALQDKCLRIYAELENFKKRAAKDQEELAKFSNERLLKEILPIVDNFERAMLHSKETQETEKIQEGLELVHKQLLDVLSKFGVATFESQLKPFDPTIHQALGQLESNEHEEGTVVEEIQKGYRLNDRILRAALVMVSKKQQMQDTENP